MKTYLFHPQIKWIELKQQNRDLEQTRKELELHIEGVVRERKHAEEKLQNVREVKQREFQVCKNLYKKNTLYYDISHLIRSFNSSTVDSCLL